MKEKKYLKGIVRLILNIRVVFSIVYLFYYSCFILLLELEKEFRIFEGKKILGACNVECSKIYVECKGSIFLVYYFYCNFFILLLDLEKKN